jgi:tetratricopeptide (TPR) repeat protein
VALEHIDPAESLAALRESARLGHSDDDLPALELAAVLLDDGQPAEAEKVLHSIIYGGEFPRNSPAQLMLARALIQQHKYDAGRQALEEIRADEWTRKSVQQLLSYVHRRLGNHDTAANASRLAQSLPPDRPWTNPLREKLARMYTNKEAYIARVNQLRNLGRFDELERVGQEGFAKFPELTYFSQGKTALLDGKPADAESAYRKALEIDADWIEALIGLGDSLAEQNKHSAAEEAFRDAIKREPSNGSAHLRLANCLMKQDKHKPAVEAFQQAVRLLPLSADAHSGLADALAKTGHDAEAVEHRRHAEQLTATSSQNGPEKK